MPSGPVIDSDAEPDGAQAAAARVAADGPTMKAVATLACWVAYAGAGGVGWLASSPTALESQGVGW